MNGEAVEAVKLFPKCGTTPTIKYNTAAASIQARTCDWANAFLGVDAFDRDHPDQLWPERPAGAPELDQIAKTKICLSYLHVIWLHCSCFEKGFRPSFFTDAELDQDPV